jgi:ABC-type ATPase with predicted acetyltransferase domain
MSTCVINKKFHAVEPPERVGEVPEPSERVLRVAEMFGIGADESYEVTLYDGLALDVRPGDVVYVTGPSGGGKSVLLRCLAEELGRAWPDVQCVDLAEVEPPPDQSVIDGLAVEFETALRLVSTAGLADAFLLLRRPGALSDGQRWRLRLAHALACLLAPRHGEPGRERNEADRRSLREPARLLIADELASTLDRLCARAVAYRLRRVADRWGVTILAASAHDDLVEDLAPDVLVRKRAGPRVEVHYADPLRGREGAR